MELLEISVNNLIIITKQSSSEAMAVAAAQSVYRVIMLHSDRITETHSAGSKS